MIPFTVGAHPVAKPPAIRFLGTNQLQGIPQFIVGTLTDGRANGNHFGHGYGALAELLLPS